MSADEAKVRAARERIEQERDAARLSLDNPALTTYQQDMAASRAWAFDLAVQVLDDALAPEPSRP